MEFLEQKERLFGHAHHPQGELAKAPRQPGSARGQVWIASDVDAPLEDFKD